jgi:hypothetical protein
MYNIRDGLWWEEVRSEENEMAEKLWRQNYATTLRGGGWMARQLSWFFAWKQYKNSVTSMTLIICDSYTLKYRPWTCLPLISNKVITTPPTCHVLCMGMARGLLRTENTLYFETKCSESRSDRPSMKKASNLGYITIGHLVPPIIVSIMLSGKLWWIEDAATIGYLQENAMHVHYEDQSVNV